MVSSIRGFAQELGSAHVVKSHVEKQRSQTIQRTAATDSEYEQLNNYYFGKQSLNRRPVISQPFNLEHRSGNVGGGTADEPSAQHLPTDSSKKRPVVAGLKKLTRVRPRKPKILLMKEEKDRFDAMRKIQHDTHNFKRYSALAMSIIACKFSFNVTYCCSEKTLIWELIH